MATLAGFDSVVIDNRDTFANRERFCSPRTLHLPTGNGRPRSTSAPPTKRKPRRLFIPGQSHIGQVPPDSSQGRIRGLPSQLMVPRPYRNDLCVSSRSGFAEPNALLGPNRASSPERTWWGDLGKRSSKCKHNVTCATLAFASADRPKLQTREHSTSLSRLGFERLRERAIQLQPWNLRGRTVGRCLKRLGDLTSCDVNCGHLN